MICTCGNTEYDPYEDTLGGSVVETPVPLSNGLAIPTFGVLQTYNHFYTECTYLPIDDGSMRPFVQLSTSQEEIPYYQETVTIGVKSYPEPVLKFAEGTEFEELGDGHWVLYPISGVKDVYLDLVYTKDYQTVESIEGHITVNLVGYDSDKATLFDAVIRVVSEDVEAPFTITLAEPYFELSAEDVVLNKDNNNSASVQVTSNLQWRVVF